MALIFLKFRILFINKKIITSFFIKNYLIDKELGEASVQNFV